MCSFCIEPEGVNRKKEELSGQAEDTEEYGERNRPRTSGPGASGCRGPAVELC